MGVRKPNKPQNHKASKKSASSKGKFVQSKLALDGNPSPSTSVTKPAPTTSAPTTTSVRPRKLTAYALFVRKNMPKYQMMQKSGGGGGGLMVKCAEKWRNLDSKEKEIYAKGAEKLNEENKDKMVEKVVKQKKAKAEVTDKNTEVPVVKPVLKPKKCMVPFMFLVKQQSRSIIQEFKYKSAPQATKHLGQLWEKMSVADKQPYVDMS